MKAGIVIDNWKQPIFERHLREAGFAYTIGPGIANHTRTISVVTSGELSVTLNVVVHAAQKEAAESRKAP